MELSEAIEKIKSNPVYPPSKDNLINLMKKIKYPLEGFSIHHTKPTRNKKGDVYMHKVFKHPYVLLQKHGNGWICGLLTTDETFPDILCPVRSRFFGNSFFTKTIFIATEISGSFLNVYDNPKHLNRVYQLLKTSIYI